MEKSRIATKVSNVSYGKYAIYSIFFSTVIQAFWGYAYNAEPFWKFFIALGCWFTVFFSMKNIAVLKRYPMTIKLIVVGIMTIIAMAFAYSLFYGTAYSGEKMVVIFTNLYSTLDLVSIVFIFAMVCIDDFRVLIKVTKWMIPISIVLLIFNYQVTIESYFLNYILIYSAVFLPYVSKRDYIFFIVGYLLTLFAFWGGGRQTALLLPFVLISMLVPMFLNKKYTYYISLLILISIMFLVYYSIYHESIFYMMANTESNTQYDTTDTRTFLWTEFYEDFYKQPLPIQLFGKGVLGYYESDSFKLMHRLGIEVPILQWILQAGCVYFVLFTVIVILSIHRLYVVGNNKMSQCASILIAGYYFNCYVSNLLGCNISHLGFWMLVGFAWNSNIVKMNDVKLKSVFL